MKENLYHLHQSSHSVWHLTLNNWLLWSQLTLRHGSWELRWMHLTGLSLQVQWPPPFLSVLPLSIEPSSPCYERSDCHADLPPVIEGIGYRSMRAIYYPSLSFIQQHTFYYLFPRDSSSNARYDGQCHHHIAGLHTYSVPGSINHLKSENSAVFS